MNFPKSVRVRKRVEYQAFLNNDPQSPLEKAVKKLGVCIVFRIKNELKHPRLGITVKSKTNSVFRNHIKRQTREVFRLNRDRLGAFDYNVVVPGQVRIDFKTPSLIRASLEKIWANELVF